MVHHVAEGDQLYSNQLLHRLTLVAKLLTLALPELSLFQFYFCYFNFSILIDCLFTD